MDWEDVFNRKLRPPLVPRVRYDGDTTNFEDYAKEEIQKAEKVTERETKLFEDF
jgi:protein kinase X